MGSGIDRGPGKPINPRSQPNPTLVSTALNNVLYQRREGVAKAEPMWEGFQETRIEYDVAKDAEAREEKREVEGKK